MPVTPTPSTNKNWLLVKFRKWHSWGGLFLSVFILLVAVTGILLNHKDAIFHRGEKGEGPSGLLASTTNLAAVPITFERALGLAREHYGDVPLEKVELKDEHGQLMYKIARGHGEEIHIDATSGAMTSKYGMKIAAAGTTSLNWAKIVDDLHTGKIFGTAGKLTIDATSGVIILLTLSGIYLWGAPLVRKRQNARNRQTAEARAPSSPAEQHATLPSAGESDSQRRQQRIQAVLAAARRPVPVAAGSESE